MHYYRISLTAIHLAIFVRYLVVFFYFCCKFAVSSNNKFSRYKMKRTLSRIKQRLYQVRDILFGNRNYQKFVIITRSRTGSNLLVSLLNNHPNIHSEGEVFRRIGGTSCLEIWNSIFTSKLSRIKYVGFKIFYYHPLDSDDISVWNYLKEDHEIKVIHLRRENMLQTIVSRKIAGKTDVWSSAGNNKLPLSERQIFLTAQECNSEFSKTEDNERLTRDNFSTHPFLEVTYEDLVDNNQKVMNNIFEFLGIPSFLVSSKLKKQNGESLSNLITNFNSLKQEFVNTKYEHFFSNNIKSTLK